MPKLGMEPIRRDALVKATIAEIGRVGSLEVTVNQIARRAGMSPALAHHYFGAKEQMFLAAMLHILGVFGAGVRQALLGATSPRDRTVAIIHASFSDPNFQPEVISAWLNFYILAQTSSDARRLLRIYQRRLHSNLSHALRPVLGTAAGAAANSLGALIDGVYIRHALKDHPADHTEGSALVLWHLDQLLKGVPQ